MTRETDRRVLAKRGGFTFSPSVAVAVPVEALIGNGFGSARSGLGGYAARG